MATDATLSDPLYAPPVIPYMLHLCFRPATASSKKWAYFWVYMDATASTGCVAAPASWPCRHLQPTGAMTGAVILPGGQGHKCSLPPCCRGEESRVTGKRERRSKVSEWRMRTTCQYPRGGGTMNVYVYVYVYVCLRVGNRHRCAYRWLTTYVWGGGCRLFIIREIYVHDMHISR